MQEPRTPFRRLAERKPPEPGCYWAGMDEDEGAWLATDGAMPARALFRLCSFSASVAALPDRSCAVPEWVCAE